MHLRRILQPVFIYLYPECRHCTGEHDEARDDEDGAVRTHLCLEVYETDGGVVVDCISKMKNAILGDIENVAFSSVVEDSSKNGDPKGTGDVASEGKDGGCHADLFCRYRYSNEVGALGHTESHAEGHDRERPDDIERSGAWVDPDEAIEADSGDECTAGDHVARLYFADEFATDRCRNHECKCKRKEKIARLGSGETQKCLSEDRDEKYTSHHGHEYNEVVEDSVDEKGIFEKLEIHDGLGVTVLDHYENDHEDDDRDVAEDAIDRRPPPVEARVEDEDER